MKILFKPLNNGLKFQFNSLEYSTLTFLTNELSSPPPAVPSPKPVSIPEFEDPSILNMGSTLPPGLSIPRESPGIDQHVSDTIARLGSLTAQPVLTKKEPEAYTWQQTQSMLNGNRYNRGGRDSPRVSTSLKYF